MMKMIILVSICLLFVGLFLCAAFSGLECERRNVNYPRAFLGPKCIDTGMSFYMFFFGKQAAKVNKRVIDYIGFGLWLIFIAALIIALSFGGYIKWFQ